MYAASSQVNTIQRKLDRSKMKIIELQPSKRPLHQKPNTPYHRLMIEEHMQHDYQTE